MRVVARCHTDPAGLAPTQQLCYGAVWISRCIQVFKAQISLATRTKKVYPYIYIWRDPIPSDPRRRKIEMKRRNE